jgi:hypothetical protein
MRKLLVSGLTILLLTGLVVLVASCGSGTSSPAAPASTSSPAAKLAFTTQPVGAAAGSAFSTQPVVAIEDEEGNIITVYRGLVELMAIPGNGTGEAQLFGGTKIISENGVAEFKALSINKAGTYRLTAASGTLASATSEPFPIVPGPPAQLAFTTWPTGGVAGSPLTPQPVVTVQDHFGNTVIDYQGSVTISATVSLVAGTPEAALYGGTDDQTKSSAVAIDGTLTVPVVNSAAHFTDISAHLAVPYYSLTATSSSLESASSSFFTISAAAPAKLEFTVQPIGATAGTPFETQPKVAIEDMYGNVAKSSRASISLSITPGSGTPGAALSGTTMLVAEDAMGGLAEFTDLSIDRAGLGYTLTATSSGLPSVTSQTFDVPAPN